MCASCRLSFCSNPAVEVTAKIAAKHIYYVRKLLLTAPFFPTSQPSILFSTTSLRPHELNSIESLTSNLSQVLLTRTMATCYYPNGNPSPGDIPCNGGGDATMCCPLNWKCESNGLCSLANAGFYGRYTCTDKTWGSSNCKKEICTESKCWRFTIHLEELRANCA